METKFEKLISIIGEETMLMEIESYLSSDELEELCDHVVRMYDIDEDELED